MSLISQITGAMIKYNAGDPRRVHHLLKVHAFARAIGELEGLDESTQEILEIAALTHDIGIKLSEQKYGSASGEHQQVEGPPEAEKLLRGLGVGEPVIDRVCWLIAHHHTYHDIQGLDYQILVEADFLVNVYEDGMEQEAIQSVRERVFRTGTGKMFLDRMFPCAIPQQ